MSTESTNIRGQRLADQVTEGPIITTVLRLAWPVMLGMLLEFALSTTDYYWVGRLGAHAQDAITSSRVVIWTVFAIISLISVGITALVSRYIGARQFDEVSYFIRQGLAMAVILAVLVMIAGWFVTPSLIGFMKAAPDTAAYAVPYLRIFFLAAPLFFINHTVYAVYRASGDTRTPTLVTASVVLINLILDPFLIFGIGPFPELGVAGASIATGIAELCGLVTVLTLVISGKLGYKVERLFRPRPSLMTFIRIGRIGLPMSSQQIVFVGVYWFLIRVVHHYGEEAGAAMGIGNSMESFSYLISFGISLAAATMVGQNLGAQKPDRAARCAWGAIGVGVAITFVMSIIFIVFPEQIAGVFTDNERVIDIAVDYLIILGISQVAMAVEIVLEGAFGGAGDTVPPMLIQVPGSLLRIPLAYWLCFGLDWGVNGVWWTLTITSVIKSIVLVAWFARGKWQTKQI